MGKIKFDEIDFRELAGNSSIYSARAKSAVISTRESFYILLDERKVYADCDTSKSETHWIISKNRTPDVAIAPYPPGCDTFLTGTPTLNADLLINKKSVVKVELVIADAISRIVALEEIYEDIFTCYKNVKTSKKVATTREKEVSTGDSELPEEKPEGKSEPKNNKLFPF